MAASACQSPKRDVQISKALSWILRHGAHKVGVPVTTAGFAPVAAVLAVPKMFQLEVTMDDLLKVRALTELGES